MIQCNIDSDGIAILQWDMPDYTANVLNAASLKSFKDTLDDILNSNKIKGVIITSNKNDFMVGGDLNAFHEAETKYSVIQAVHDFKHELRRLEQANIPFVAAINGSALGPGLELCLACQYRICVDKPGTLLGLPEILLGLLPGAGGTQRLPRLIGIQKAAPFLLEGQKTNPQKALEAGFIDKIVQKEALIAEAKAWIDMNPSAQQPWDKKGYEIPGKGVLHERNAQFFIASNALVRKKTWGNFPAIPAMLSCLYEGLQLMFDKGLEVESKYFQTLANSKEAAKLVKTLFVGRLAANKLSKRPVNIEPFKGKQIGVIGAGMMGRAITYVAIRHGLEVILLDASDELTKKAKDVCKKQIEAEVAKNRMTPDVAKLILGNLKTAKEIQRFSNCDLVIEAVTEDKSIKQQVLSSLLPVLKSDAIVASNTSKLSINTLASYFGDEKRFIGLHFFSPVERMPLIEVIKGNKTDEKTIAHALDFSRQMNKTPILINDSRGFFTTRVFQTYVLEGMIMLAEGVNPALIENAARMAGMPVGPLALCDEVSLTLLQRVMADDKAELGKQYVATPADCVIDVMVNQLGRLGKKCQSGFYEYQEAGSKQLWSELSQYFPLASTQPSVTDVKQRFLFVQSIEAIKAMAEGVLSDPDDADLASVLGLGFPIFTGGVVSYIDYFDKAKFIDVADQYVNQYGERFKMPNTLPI